MKGKKKFVLASIFESIANLFGKKKDESIYDAQIARLKKAQQHTVSNSAAESNEGKMKDAARTSGTSASTAAGTTTSSTAGTNVPIRKPSRDRKTREEEIAKMTGLSAPKQYSGPGEPAGSGESNNFKHWLGGSGQ